MAVYTTYAAGFSPATMFHCAAPVTPPLCRTADVSCRRISWSCTNSSGCVTFAMLRREEMVSALSLFMEEHKQILGVEAMNAPQKRAALQAGAKAWKQLDEVARKPWVDRAEQATCHANYRAAQASKDKVAQASSQDNRSRLQQTCWSSSDSD